VALEAVAAAGVSPGLLQARYGPALGALAGAEGAMAAGVARAVALPPAIDAETWLAAAAERHTSGDTARMAQRLLDDFRRGVLGAIALELPG
jgi:ribosome biogenesis GTPase A